MKIHHLLFGLMCLSMPLLYSCGNDDTPDQPQNPQLGVKMSIACVSKGALSRATSPSHEYGFDNENSIESAIIIVYNSPLNSSNDGKIRKIITLSSSDLGTGADAPANTTESLKWYNTAGEAKNISYNNLVARRYDISGSTSLASHISQLNDMRQSGETFYAIALANISTADLGSIAVGSNVSDLREFVYGGPLYSGPSKTTGSGNNSVLSCKNFAMTAINEVVVDTEFDSQGLVTIPTLMVQRLAARIDVAFGNPAPSGSNYDTKSGNNYPYDYEVIDQSGHRVLRFPVYDEDLYAQTTPQIKRIDNVYFDVTEIELQNCVTAGTYLFEHSSADASGNDPRILGNEGSWSSSGKPNYFILSPTRTIEGSRKISDVVAAINNARTNKYSDNLYHTDDVYSFYYTLGYVGENTYRSSESNKKYSAIKITGESNLLMIADDQINTNSNPAANPETISMSISKEIRHSFGALANNDLDYGVVRNTIYRVYFRFFANKEQLVVRWYYYKGNNNNFSDEAYSVSINKYINENPNGPTDD